MGIAIDLNTREKLSQEDIDELIKYDLLAGECPTRSEVLKVLKGSVKGFMDEVFCQQLTKISKTV